ncbi:MAG: metal-dependent phosphohydrolase [Mycobacteriales bacterium]
MDLSTEWAALLERMGLTPAPVACAALLDRYAEPHRQYHTPTHLAAVLSTVDSLADVADDADLVRLSAWYHDAVYDPRRDDNEERSAALAESDLASAGLAAPKCARVARLVRMTAGHLPPIGDTDAAVLCDADLAVLASPAPGYDAYVAAVRREYAHVDDADWRTGRGAVLRGLLEREEVFRTPPARAWEDAARDNLSRELSALASPSGGAARPQ